MNIGTNPQGKLRRRFLPAAAVAVVLVVWLSLVIKGRTGNEPAGTDSANDDSVAPGVVNSLNAAEDTDLATDQIVGDETHAAFRVRAWSLSDAPLKEVRRLADAGDVVAMVVLAWRYEIGKGLAIDYFEADAWYTRAARQGSSEAARSLDRMNARVLATGSGSRNHTDCLVRTGLWQTVSPAESARYFRQAAERGEPAAMVKLAHALTEGTGVDQDFAQAGQWREKAIAAYTRLAENGDPAAMLGLGEILLARSLSKDAEFERDEAQGIEWCKRAVEAGNPEAMLLLADLHLHGRGVEQNQSSAFNLVQQASECGNGRAMGRLAAMFESGQGTPRDEIAATQWYQRAARVGDVDALIRLGQRLATDLGSGKDEEAAVDCFLRAIRVGDDSGEAAYQAGLAFASGSGAERNDATAIEFFRHAAQRNHPDALFQLGQMFYQGKGVDRDQDQAEFFFLRAAGLGHQGAMRAMRISSETGEGVDPGAELAATWKASPESSPSAAEDVVGRPAGDIESVTSWGILTATQGDASAVVEHKQLRLKFNMLSPRPDSSLDGFPNESAGDGANLNGPRILQDVSGDFVAAVTMPGPLHWERPPITDGSTSSLPLGVVSLLMWQNQDNYVRIDRVGKLQGDQFQFHCDVVMVQDGTQVFQASKDLESAPVRVRLERNGERVRASLTTDGGQSWTTFRSQVIKLPAEIQVGVAASSDAEGPLTAVFSDLELVPRD